MLPLLREARCFTEGNGAFYRTIRKALLGLLLCAPALLFAEQHGEFSFEIQPDGTPRFTQVLQWQGDPNALFYDVTVQTADGKEISETRTADPELKLNLSPGEYRYHVVLYNLLRRPEVSLPWQSFSVLKAEFPHISESAPKMWFLEDLKPLLQLTGENLMPEATVSLKRDDVPAQPIVGTETARDGTGNVKVAFSATGFEAGTYSIEITNPGGLSFTYPNALVIRHMLPAPTGLSPGPTTVYGPKQLRGMTSIRFSWDPVPEATHYVFRLYSASDSQRVLRTERVFGTDCLLGDLTVLDRGKFRWTVEPVGSDGARGTIPAVSAAESQFVIELVELAAPSVQPGDLFYGK